MSRLFALSLLLILVQTTSLHAVTRHKLRTYARFKQQCDEQGSGKACYDYGRALWTVPGFMDRKLAKKYLIRGCELKYKLACDTAHDRDTHRRRMGKLKAYIDEPGVCFSSNELDKARLTPNPAGAGTVLGQKIDMIKKHSFWEKVGLVENDIIVRVNNMPFNNSQETLKAFSSSGKKFGFQINRGGETVTLWYTCK